ncbi:MAG: prepilin-type N-terminal cleavage/methylation domain-containing protein [Polyangiales bacterium]
MKRAGYTLIEVMTAVVVMTIGASGIVAMQGAAVRANQDANETTNAVNFASTWIERIKRDGRRWNATGSADLANTQWLQSALTNPATPPWFVPTSLLAPEQPAADLYGYDTSSEFITQNNGDPLANFCVNLRMTVVQSLNPLNSFNPASEANAVRADVRVWWFRNASDTDRSSRTCRSGVLTAQELDSPGTSWRFRKTYLSNVVGWRAVGWP